NMNMMQNLMGRLRPIVGLKSWDYCVLWKLSEDQRFLEWMDCCCSGVETTQSAGEELLFLVSSVVACRDVMFQHQRTQSCDLLSQLPSSMPLDSGIHGQTLIANQPKWLNFCHSSDSSVSEENLGTKVLVPVPGGLIELFVARQVSEDQHVIDYVTAQTSLTLDQEVLMNSNNIDAITNLKDFDNHFQSQTAVENLNLPYEISDQIRLSNSAVNLLPQFHFNGENRSRNDFFFEESNESFLSDKPIDPFSSPVQNGYQDIESLPESTLTSVQIKEQQGSEKVSLKRERGQSDSMSEGSDQIDDDEDHKYRRRNGKGPQSKNLMAERKRRKKLNDRLYSLRSLVPKISKLDRASILGDAIEFVKELQKQAKELQDELEENPDDEGGRNTGTLSNLQSEILNQNALDLGTKTPHEKATIGLHVGSTRQVHDSEINNDKSQQMEAQVEVAQIEGNAFTVKVFCEHKRGGFVSLLEALDSLGLEVTNANVTNYLSLVSYVLKVEKRDTELVQADHVRDSLLEITRNSTAEWADMARTATENDRGNMDYHHHHHHHNLHNYHINSHHHHHLHN
ncbi:Myc-type, basic helix-loop-helix (bHLH) domain, partial [Dillenia turbinata]